MTMPNFLIIGAAKCGTESLCQYLAQHPDIFIPPYREPHFFVAEGQHDIPYEGPGDRATIQDLHMWVSRLDDYQSLFRDVTAEKAVGEGSVPYIYDEGAAVRIQKHIPQAKLIAILRNPVDRAYSAYTMLLRDGRESIGNFASALAAEEQRTRRNWEPTWHYVKAGFYARQLKRYYTTFDPSQIRVIVYDDFNTKPTEVLREVFQFLEVDPSFVPDVSVRYNVSLVPKNLRVHTLVAGDYPVKRALKTVFPAGIRQAMKQCVASRNLTRPRPIQPAIRRRLIDVFRPDILDLQDMLGRDLSHWLQ